MTSRNDAAFASRAEVAMALGDDSARARSELAQRLGHVLWIGGGTGGGKASFTRPQLKF